VAAAEIQRILQVTRPLVVLRSQQQYATHRHQMGVLQQAGVLVVPEMELAQLLMGSLLKAHQVGQVFWYLR
jgi:hypothetical protein